MYELKYVKKRKTKMWVAISGGVATVVVSTLSIVAFLGRYVGTFTVSLDTGKVELALSDSSAFSKKESFLRIDSLPAFHEYTYSSLPDDDRLDSEETNYLTGAVYKSDGITVDSMNYFKYTFFIRNVGKVPATYSVKIKLTDNKAGEEGRTLDDTLRTMLYETNLETGTRTRSIYAKRAAVHHIDENGVANFQEPISISEEAANEGEPFPGYAEMFESANVITTWQPTSGLAVGETRRYTIVNWLEGYDPQSNNYSAPPKGARIKLGVEINAYES
jgi:hypothetical protein